MMIIIIVITIPIKYKLRAGACVQAPCHEDIRMSVSRSVSFTLEVEAVAVYAEYMAKRKHLLGFELRSTYLVFKLLCII
jgi:hypothetical protein